MPPRRAALAGFVGLAAVAFVLGRMQPGWAHHVELAAVAAGVLTLLFGGLAWGDGSLGAAGLLVQLAVLGAAIGGVFAAMILGHWYLVTPKLPEAPLILLSRTLVAVSGSAGRPVRDLDGNVGRAGRWIAVQRADGRVGPVRVAPSDHRPDLPAGRIGGGGQDRPDPIDGVGDGPALHQRRHDRAGTILAAGLYFGAGLLV